MDENKGQRRRRNNLSSEDKEAIIKIFFEVEEEHPDESAFSKNCFVAARFEATFGREISDSTVARTISKWKNPVSTVANKKDPKPTGTSEVNVSALADALKQQPC